MSYVEVKLREWEELLPEKDSPLFQRFVDDPASKILVEELNGRGIINVSELRSGLKIVTNSHVGSVQIGDIQLSVAPKIEGMPLSVQKEY
ncbi:MAG TPA: hypothetical protein DDW87_02260, partial [Firmicutes bacterium]|nr:hypothetical protein [Bacillota bacterium]